MKATSNHKSITLVQFLFFRKAKGMALQFPTIKNISNSSLSLFSILISLKKRKKTLSNSFSSPNNWQIGLSTSHFFGVKMENYWRSTLFCLLISIWGVYNKIQRENISWRCSTAIAAHIWDSGTAASDVIDHIAIQQWLSSNNSWCDLVLDLAAWIKLCSSSKLAWSCTICK